jgi:hypothetical protein
LKSTDFVDWSISVEGPRPYTFHPGNAGAEVLAGWVDASQTEITTEGQFGELFIRAHDNTIPNCTGCAQWLKWSGWGIGHLTYLHYDTDDYVPTFHPGDVVVDEMPFVIATRAVTEPTPGDFNRNGDVDAADYVVWRNGLGSIHAPGDFDTWRANFGKVSAIRGILAAPEPTSYMLMLVAALLLLVRRRLSTCALSLVITLFLATGAHSELPTFETIDQRLPNPDRPYDMTTGAVQFPPGYGFGLYDLKFQPTNPAQLDSLSRNKDGNWEFDSVFDIAYEAQVGFGLGPVQGVKGTGTAHIRGTEVASPVPADSAVIVLDTELTDLNLVGLSSDSGFLFRESPTLRSGGVTMLEDTCPVCARPVTIYRMSSYLDIFAEVSAGGGTWEIGDKSFRVVQQASPVVLGDYNQNGVVDAADYVVWRHNIGPGTIPNEAGVSPGTVDEADYNYWRSRFGARAAFHATSASSIPEPTTSYLFLVTAVFVLLNFFLRR